MGGLIEIMSKKNYQEALDRLANPPYFSDTHYEYKTVTQSSILREDDYNTLQEACEKAEKYDSKEKVIEFVDMFGVVKCGCCKEPITHPKYGSAKYCLHCGQRI